MRTRLVILGTAGNSIDILDLLESLHEQDRNGSYECVGFLDDAPELHRTQIRGIPILGPLAAARELPDCMFVNGIGSPNTFTKKAEIISRAGVPTDRFVTIVHPSASVSRTALLGRGTVIFPNVTIASNVRIGDHVIILSNSVINHDASIGDCVCITSGVCVSGGVTIGRSTYLGSNCSIIEQIAIGERCLVGMGSVVLNRVADNSIVVGNPARFLRHSV